MQNRRPKKYSREPSRETLSARAPRAADVLNAIADAVLCTDVRGLVTYLNPVAEVLTGYTSEEAVGRPRAAVFRVVDSETRKPANDPSARAVGEDENHALFTNCILVRRDGVEHFIEDSVAPISDSDGQVTGEVIVFRDVSAARDEAARLVHHARHDPLTDLPNRLLFADRITAAIALARRHRRRGAVLFLDVDHFKPVNDSFGHSVGDRLLQSIARRILGCVRESDTVSRHGGDEFVVLLPEIEHGGEAVVSARRILHALSAPHQIAGHDLEVTASIGICHYPERGWDAKSLIACADAAMYRAKESGRNRYEVYTEDMRDRCDEQTTSAAGPHRAADRDAPDRRHEPDAGLETRTRSQRASAAAGREDSVEPMKGASKRN